MKKIEISYVICAVQRSGSFLLCEALKNSGLAGVPEEYFLYHPDGSNWENHPWARGHGVTTRQEFLKLVQEKGTTDNGVFGTKLMWNYFDAFASGLHEMAEYQGLEPPELLQTLFPNTHYIWIVRNNKVRQAVSWAIAAQTGIYAAWQAEVQEPLQEPVYDFEQIDLLHRLVLEGEAGWLAFFEKNNITPFKVVYEEFVNSYEETGLQILDFLGVSYPDNLALSNERKMKKQATNLNDEWAQRYREERRKGS